MPDLPKISPLGDNAVTVDFGNVISIELNDRAISLAEYLTAHPFPGLIEAAPAYSSVSVFYDLITTSSAFPEYSTAFEAVRVLIEHSLAGTQETPAANGRLVEIPVDFGADAALDLEDVAANARLSTGQVVDLFTGTNYRVYMLGFLPGFAYMGEVDERIAMPRRQTPRLKVPKGSVGIAGRQTGVYPLESPGGWQIIGRTDTELFTPEDDSPCLLRPGDNVRFVPR